MKEAIANSLNQNGGKVLDNTLLSAIAYSLPLGTTFNNYHPTPTTNATQEELVTLALQELVRSRRKKNLLDLAGQIQFTEDFDHKDLRETRHAAD